MKVAAVLLAGIPCSFYFWSSVLNGHNPLLDIQYYLLGFPPAIVSFWIGFNYKA